MKTYRKNAITAGILLLLGFAGVVTMLTSEAVLGQPDYLTQLAANSNRVLTGVFFYFIMALACGGIAIALYPVLKKYSQSLALGAAGFRLLETPLQMLGALSVLLLLTLSQNFVAAGAPAASHFQSTAALLLAANDWLGEVLMILPWIFGAAMYHFIFFKTRLIPRWLSLWGLIGAPLALAGCLFAIFGVIQPGDSLQTVLNLPLGLQEIPLALCLIVKGFNPSALISLSANENAARA
jgi:hypothetical protein